MANNLVNALQAKRRFVESLTHQSNYSDHETFLSPPIQHPLDESSKPTRTPQPSATPQTDVKTKKLPQKSQREIILTESEYQRIINLLESRQKRTDKTKQARREENVPDWAKLAYASSNPNNQSDQYY